ncbi:ABC transporter substrate-binding protein [Candidatus Woesearchaeota archaeon]|nr:ABC transporter substrate-binding protein [Candidatus Woesearchaeota archaeon]
MKKIIVISAAALLIIFIFLFVLYGILKETKPIKIGFLGEISDEKHGKAALEGAQSALQKINTKANNKYELIVYDTKNQKSLIEGNALKLANEDKVIAIISTFPEHAEILEQYQVPTILIGKDKLKAESRNNFYWSIELSHIMYDGVLPGLRAVIKSNKINSAVVLSDDYPYKKQYASTAKEILPLLSVSLLGYYSLNDNNLFVENIKQSNPDLIVLSTNSINGINFLKEAKGKNLKSKAYLGNFELSEPTFSAEYGNLPESLYLQPFVTSTFESSLISERNFTQKALMNSSFAGLNAYDAMNFLDVIIAKTYSLAASKNLQKDREEVIKEMWTTSYNTERGLLSPNKKTGFLRREFSSISLVRGATIVTTNEFIIKNN